MRHTICFANFIREVVATKKWQVSRVNNNLGELGQLPQQDLAEGSCHGSDT